MTEAFGAGRKVRIGKKEYIVRPLTLNDLIAAEEEFGPDWRETQSLAVTRFVLHRRLVKAQPDLTLEDVGEMFGEDNMDDIMAVMGVEDEDEASAEKKSEMLLMES